MCSKRANPLKNPENDAGPRFASVHHHSQENASSTKCLQNGDARVDFPVCASLKDQPVVHLAWQSIIPATWLDGTSLDPPWYKGHSLLPSQLAAANLLELASSFSVKCAVSQNVSRSAAGHAI
jgi:hypothetical protein